jgi:hypothetical protein
MRLCQHQTAVIFGEPIALVSRVLTRHEQVFLASASLVDPVRGSFRVNSCVASRQHGHPRTPKTAHQTPPSSPTSANQSSPLFDDRHGARRPAERERTIYLRDVDSNCNSGRCTTNMT